MYFIKLNYEYIPIKYFHQLLQHHYIEQIKKQAYEDANGRIYVYCYNKSRLENNDVHFRK